MTAYAPEVIADPIGVIIDLVADIDPGLGRTTLEKTVTSVAGGRAKRRKLAQALVERPAVLTDGRSPAPRGIGDLLNALREAGATAISPPTCTKCGKPLRTLQRRGENWYCAACVTRREICVGCGLPRLMRYRDRDGRARCQQCGPPDSNDPVETIAKVVTTIDPELASEAVTTAIKAAIPQPGSRYKVAWALQERPELLTGAGAQAPFPTILRLIDLLHDAGSTSVIRPACPRCNRVVVLTKRDGDDRICRTCYAHLRLEECVRCGAIQQVGTRDEHGRALCLKCLVNDLANHEECIGCGHRRPVNTRTPDGPLCQNCRPWKILTCGICGRQAPCLISKTTGQPWCRACKQRWARCTGCGEVRPIRGGSRDEPLCATCTRPDPDFWSSCPTCGRAERVHAGQCARCTIEQRLHEVLGDETGTIRPHLQALYQALTAAERPSTVTRWLNRSAAPQILNRLNASTELTHTALDELPDGKPVEHLRSVLVAIGTLPPRDEHMARLERWITTAIAGRTHPEEQQILHRYALWHVLRRLRRRTSNTETTHNQLVGARTKVQAAIALLDWLSARDLTLATTGPSDLEAWLTDNDATHRRDAGNFVRWAKKQKLTRLDFPATRWGGPAGTIDTETRWEQARWLLHDDTLKPEDRVAGLLVVLYAQWPAVISRLTLDHVKTNDNEVHLHLGREPVVLPEPLAGLMLQVAATRQGHATLGDRGTSPWLFPGGQPGRPISAFQLGQRLRQLGLHPGQDRSAALFQLATDLPAAVLARMLGIHIAVAVAWQRASAGDWTTYAADVSRRTQRTRPDQPERKGPMTGMGSDQPAQTEEALIGDGVTPDIVRIGETVRRPVRPFTATIQAYLAHLHEAGFPAPTPLGIDEQGREILSFVPGDVPREPLPPEATGEGVLVALAGLIRRLHDAAQGWTPPADAVWAALPGTEGIPLVDTEGELVSHRDYCPGNVVFRNGRPAALIDFDLARPTTRVYDIANALYWWAPLLHPKDRAPSLIDADIPHRAAVFADAYGMTDQQRRDLVPMATRMVHRFHQTARAAAEADPVFRRFWDEGVKDRMPRAEAWLAHQGPALTARLTTPTPDRQP